MHTLKYLALLLFFFLRAMLGLRPRSSFPLTFLFYTSSRLTSAYGDI